MSSAAHLLVTGLLALCLPAVAGPDGWTPQEVQTIASMRLKQLGDRPADPSNAYESRSDAAALGRALFNDTRLSANGRVSCASCHSADLQFQDGRRVGQGIGIGKRRTMPVMGASHSPFLFWDGRKDSLWSQALGPMEDAAEHGGNRVRLVAAVQAHYKAQYEQVFGPFPALAGLPADWHFLLCVPASASSVVPFSTATDLPQMSAIELIEVPPDALVMNDSPAMK